MLAEIFGVDGIIVIVVVAIVLLFGGSKLPQLARGLGSASHEFKKGVQEGAKADEEQPAEPAVAAPALPASVLAAPEGASPAVAEIRD
jgi:sec-independent protein translocase protein TatA